MNEPESTSHKFYANENFPLPAVTCLRALGHDVVTTNEVGFSNRGLPDSDVLEYAISVQRVVVTFNRRDFVRLHFAKAGKHSGIVVCSEDRDYKALAERIHSQVRTLTSLSEQLIRIDRPQA